VSSSPAARGANGSLSAPVSATETRMVGPIQVTSAAK